MSNEKVDMSLRKADNDEQRRTMMPLALSIDIVCMKRRPVPMKNVPVPCTDENLRTMSTVLFTGVERSNLIPVVTVSFARPMISDSVVENIITPDDINLDSVSIEADR